MSIHATEQGERIVREASATARGDVIAYQLGCLYPGFEGAPRGTLAAIFDRHGFPKAAERIRDIDGARALGAVVSSVGAHRRDAVKVDALEADTVDSHVRAWGVYRVARQPGERRSAFLLGARVFACPAGVYSAEPIDSPEIPELRAIADELADRARWLVQNADTTAISRAVCVAVGEAHVYGFISRGSYVARAGTDATDRVLALFAELRAEFYDPATRKGLRCSAVAVTAYDTQALSDAVIDDAEEQAAKLVATLRQEAGSGTVRLTTLQKRRDECAGMLAGLAPVKGLVGQFAERIEAIVRGVQAAYDAAESATDLQFPDWLNRVSPVTAAESSPVVPASEPAAARPVAPALETEASDVFSL
jgi:hypothetical protein